MNALRKRMKLYQELTNQVDQLQRLIKAKKWEIDLEPDEWRRYLTVNMMTPLGRAFKQAIQDQLDDFESRVEALSIGL